VEAWLRCGPAVAGLTVVNGQPLVEEGQPLMKQLPDVLRGHARHARRIQCLEA